MVNSDSLIDKATIYAIPDCPSYNANLPPALETFEELIMSFSPHDVALEPIRAELEVLEVFDDAMHLILEHTKEIGTAPIENHLGSLHRTLPQTARPWLRSQ